MCTYAVIMHRMSQFWMEQLFSRLLFLLLSKLLPVIIIVIKF